MFTKHIYVKHVSISNLINLLTYRQEINFILSFLFGDQNFPIKTFKFTNKHLDFHFFLISKLKNACVDDITLVTSTPFFDKGKFSILLWGLVFCP